MIKKNHNFSNSLAKNLKHKLLRIIKKCDEACSGISTRGFWCSGQKRYFDISIFNPMAMTHKQETQK